MESLIDWLTATSFSHAVCVQALIGGAPDLGENVLFDIYGISHTASHSLRDAQALHVSVLSWHPSLPLQNLRSDPAAPESP